MTTAQVMPKSDEVIEKPAIIDNVVSINPATGARLGDSPMDTPERARQAIHDARQAQLSWAALSFKQRTEYMMRIRDYILDNIDHIAEVVSRDVGKTRTEALTTEIMPTVIAITYYCRKGKKFLASRRLSGSSLLFFNKYSRLHRLPFGVIGIIAPWNYPMGIPMHEIVPALLAGNTVVFKTASETQMVGRLIEKIMDQAKLPDHVFTYLNLSGSVASNVMLDSRCHVDKLFFTGSVPVGKQLMALAAKTLTPVSLELGGNDAMLVCEDAPVDRAVNCAIWAGLQNAGQSCGGVERIYVHEAIYEAFLVKLKARVENLRQGPDLDHEVDLGAMCTRRQLESVAAHVKDALDKGATLYAQSRVDDRDGQGHFHPAVVLTDVTHDMDVMRDETFGPVLGVMKVKNMDEAIGLANDSHLGLTGSVWSKDRKKAVAVGRRIQAGTITINDHLFSHGAAETPWGGLKESGIGRSHGQFGFDEMTEPQVIVNDWLTFAKRNVFWQPYGARIYSGLKSALFVIYGSTGQRLRHIPGFIGLVQRMFRKEG